MDNRIEKIKKFRKFLLDQISELSAEQLNKIPQGFNNNIIWNLAHLICAQQGICYLRGGQQIVVPDKFIAPFFTNTKPERIIDSNEIQEIKSLFLTTIDQLQLDYDKTIFRNYTPSPNILKVYGIEIQGIDDALEFLLNHEGYHCGCVLALKRLVS
ncbi:MAG: DinB family protein [Bacteroidota bacterium]